MTHHVQNHPFPWAMCIVPFLEGLFFVLAAAASNLLVSLMCLLVAGLFLSYSIHIFFHECVHVRSRFPGWFNSISSIFLGLPFDGYRVHHYNHHTYDNHLEDFSTTWRKNDDETPAVGFTVASYTLGWPRQLIRAVKEPNPFANEFGNPHEVKSRIPVQKKAIAAFLFLLLIINWRFAILYIALIYIGWTISALHNFGQHPPLEGSPIGSYNNQLYNRLLFNNGLHSEHHKYPSLPWHELVPDKNSYEIGCAHFLYPVYHRSII